jgi:hypothetical protein
MASKQETLRHLRDEVRHLVASKRYAQALASFGKLEALEPAEPEWPRRASECHAALKRPKEQAEALARAAERFERARVAKKAEALCRLSIKIDPRNARARALLDELERVHQPSPPVVAPLVAPPVAPASPSGQVPAREDPKPPAPTPLELALRARRKVDLSAKK